VLQKSAAKKAPSAAETATDTSTTASTTGAAAPNIATTAAPAPEEGDFPGQKRRKWVNASESDRPGSATKQSSTTQVGKAMLAAAVTTKNYFSPLKTPNPTQPKS
jgi:hypothetical protein